jgi:hypothetical protein
MTDIAARLRDPAYVEKNALLCATVAADEIERLTAALDRLTTQRRQDIGQLRAENDRLQAALSKAIDELSYTDLRASGGIAEAP